MGVGLCDTIMTDVRLILGSLSLISWLMDLCHAYHHHHHPPHPAILVVFFRYLPTQTPQLERREEEEEEEGNLGGKLDFSEERLPVSQSWHIATSSHFSAALRHPGTPPGRHTLSHSDWNFLKTNKLRLGREIKDINLVGWLSLSAELNYFPISCSSSSFNIGELGRANVNQRSPC